MTVAIDGIVIAFCGLCGFAAASAAQSSLAGAQLCGLAGVVAGMVVCAFRGERE